MFRVYNRKYEVVVVVVVVVIVVVNYFIQYQW